MILTVLGYRRPEVFLQTCEALLECRGVDRYTIHVFVDSYKDAKPFKFQFLENLREDNEKTVECAKSLVERHPSIHLHLAPTNYGITKMTDWCSKVAFASSEFWTHWEEDIFPMKDALEFLDWGQNMLKTHPHILQALAYGHGKYKPNNENKALIYCGFCPWAFTIHKSHQKTVNAILSDHLIVMPTWDSMLNNLCKIRKLCFLLPAVSRVDKIPGDNRSMHEWRSQPRDKSDLFGCEKQNFQVAERSMEALNGWGNMGEEEKSGWDCQSRKKVYEEMFDDGMW